MNHAVFLLAAVNFGLIAALPRIFFKSGRFTLLWWLTASPFFLSGVAIAASLLGLLPLFLGSSTPAGRIASAVATLAYAAALALIGFTLGTHRIPVSLWHQVDDPPQHIVTWGAYAYIRHPFYASFLLTLTGSLLLAPNWGTLAACLAGLVMLNATAAREERRLSASEFGEEYRRYLEHTGRFFPHLTAFSGGRS
jgi:protein-S-isoprenylcysteine O-methyltransferase Ste14